MPSSTVITLDVVLLLPAALRARAIASSDVLSRRMAADGHSSHFRLGNEYQGIGGECEPHVSLFMLAVTQPEVRGVVDAVRDVGRAVAPLPVQGREYRHNPYGAPELHFAPSPAWTDVQRRVIAAVEPLRRGRLRDVGPSGERLREMMARRPPADPVAVAQLARYGYDEVTDDTADRFRPHVTLAWPDDPKSQVDLGGLPPASVYSTILSEIAVYGMSPYGTCTNEFGAFPLSATNPAPSPPVGGTTQVTMAGLG